jgi:hypothetical protein
MRIRFLLVGALALLLGSCSRKVSHAPLPLHKEWLAGKWKSGSDGQFIAGYEFTDDGKLKMSVRGMKRPVRGRYTWSGERTLDLEYSADFQEAYQAAARAYKKQVRARIEAGKLPERAGPSMLGAVQDDLPAKETFRVAIAEEPRLLMLSKENGASQTFEQVD